ncbi:hypothetical protein M2137_000179 [Parabacteroides sp. PFB2-10]|nr:hypothetical protein [Parabacteroides sp. PFB2-10]
MNDEGRQKMAMRSSALPSFLLIRFNCKQTLNLPFSGETPNLRFVIFARLCAQKGGTSETNSREKHFLTYRFVTKR